MAKIWRFVSHLCRSNTFIISNSLIVLGTLVVLILYYTYIFKCPCSQERNFDYGMATICAPAGFFFLTGILMNRSTWDLVSACRLRKCQSGAGACALMGNIIGRAIVAPLTWAFISLLDGRAYACAHVHTIDTYSMDGLEDKLRHKTAEFPCLLATGELKSYWNHIVGQFKNDSEVYAWMVLAVVIVMILLFQCIKHCACVISSQQEEYWSHYRSSENIIFQRTAAVHARLLAAEKVKDLFSFVVLDEEEKRQLDEYQSADPICSTQWKEVAGVNVYTEKRGGPPHSGLNMSDVKSKEEMQELA